MLSITSLLDPISRHRALEDKLQPKEASHNSEDSIFRYMVTLVVQLTQFVTLVFKAETRDLRLQLGKS